MCFAKIDNETLLTITSICAVFLSVVSIIITIVFSRLQVIHNKKSVRPISAIQLMDYEDDIGAKVKNVGTGPLIITRLYFRELDINTKEYSVLLDIMPKIAQYWATYVECVDGWTIPIGGEIVLIELHPENDYIKDLVRKSLTKITAYIEYTDIYGTQFQDERSFDFFGRHYK